ncbi:TadE family type IV pilus minor pilin [Nocardia sp. NPDC050697]|uniref:TadE family type IV pilus minor pilin n=1 Tax=Nocardia sp. NPDC050697 TaxID=3155158 RepID=UPI0033DAA3E7
MTTALRGDRGAVTVESAIAIATLIAVVTLCLGALLAASAQVRCVDAAREAARLAARGDRSHAEAAGRQVAPRGADITLRQDSTLVIAQVTASVPLLPGLRLRAEAVAAIEPGGTP